MKKVILFIMFLMSGICYAQKGTVHANNDSFFNKQTTSTNVLSNDKDDNGDAIGIIHYTVDGSTPYNPSSKYNAALKAKYGNVSVKSTGEVYSDTNITITYTISDKKYGTATATCRFYSKYKPKPLAPKPPAAAQDIYIIQVSKLTKDTVFNVFANDTFSVSDSFKIIYFVSDGGAYPMSMLLGSVKFSQPDCGFGTGYNKGCIQARSNGIITWGPNLLQGKNTTVQVIEAVYVAQDKKGRIIGASVTIIINP